MATLTEDIVGGRGYGIGGYGGVEGGGLGLIALLALLGGRGFGGFDNRSHDCRDCVTNESLNQQTLGDIKAAIPLSEAELQLAVAQAVGSLTTQGNANTQFLGNILNQLGLSQLVQSNTIQTAIASVDTNVDRQACAIQNTIHEDGEKTRSLIVANQIAELNQKLTVAQLENAENRSIIREQTNSHNTIVTVNQAQQQQQLQTQEIRFVLNNLLAGFGQIARATNSNVVVGSTGVGSTQTANPTNVAA